MSPSSNDGDPSHEATLALLTRILHDFSLPLHRTKSKIHFEGTIPNSSLTKSQNIQLSLIGTIPSLANAVAAAMIYEARGGKGQDITVDLRRGHNYLDPDTGMTPTLNGQEITLDLVAGNPFLSGVYETGDGRHVVPSAVYIDLVYQWCTFLGCAPNKNDVAAAIGRWDSSDLERAAEQAGLPFAVIQSTETWAATPQGQHMSTLPIVPVRKVTSTPPKVFPSKPRRPLEGLKVLCLTHAIAGPSTGRTLAEHGASVLQIMYTHGHEHPFVYTYANLGTASSRLSLTKASDVAQLWTLVREADVWIDSYRDGALSRFGFTDDALHAMNPSLIISHVRLYGTSGPWSRKPGFDMQGSASSGLMTLCGGSLATPSWPPGLVINDYTTGYFNALAIQATLLRQMTEGGGYVLSPSLCGTAMSIAKYFVSSDFPDLRNSATLPLPPRDLIGETKLGVLKTLRPLPEMSRTPLEYELGILSPMGSDLPVFPKSAGRAEYDIAEVDIPKKESLLHSWNEKLDRRAEDLKRIAKEGTLASAASRP